MPQVSIEQTILNQVTKIHFTEEKIAALAVKLGPKLEKKMEQSLMDAVDDLYLGDMIADAIAEVDMTSHISKLIRTAMGLPEPEPKKPKKKNLRGAGPLGAVAEANW